MSVANAHVGWLPGRQSVCFTCGEVALIAGISLAVLAFGGTDATTFAVVEIVFAAVAILFLARPEPAREYLSPAMIAIPTVLIGAVLFQLCPLPLSWIDLASTEDLPGGTRHFATVTIEPFATRVHLLLLLTCVISFFLAFIISRQHERKRRVILAMVILGLFEAWYGLLQYLTGWQKIFSYVKKYDLQEATGTYINRNHYAGFLEMVLPLALALGFRELRRLYKKRHEFAGDLRKVAAGSNVANFGLWISIAVMIFAGLICSRSRMGIVAASLSALLMFVFAWSSKLYGKAALLMCMVFLAASVSLAGWIGAGSVVERFQAVGQEYAAGDHSRLSIWRDTVRLIRKHPWRGTGLGTFPIAFTSVQTTFLGEFVNHAHNDYLELASDLGIPVAGALIGSLMWVVLRTIRIFRVTAKDSFDRFVALGCIGSIVAILLHSLVDFNLYIPANAVVFATILGLTMSLGRSTQGKVSG